MKSRLQVLAEASAAFAEATIDPERLMVTIARTITLAVGDSCGMSDQGIGIDPEHHERIFQRFERVESVRNYGGFGLGLWIVREILTAMGGRISVDSQPGQGARFVVELPL